VVSRKELEGHLGKFTDINKKYNDNQL
jgi:hypothetical protein